MKSEALTDFEIVIAWKVPKFGILRKDAPLLKSAHILPHLCMCAMGQWPCNQNYNFNFILKPIKISTIHQCPKQTSVFFYNN